jgi:diadenosine tetraphosphate (Ap4A) HIT family hydrolase
MTFNQLVDYLSNRMKMAHIYQPVLIKALVDSGGSATIRQLAAMFLVQDESQLLFYEDRLKKMPLKVLSKNDVVNKDGELVHLNLSQKLSLEQKAEIRALCEKRLQEFIQKKGLSIWDYRMLETEPVPDSVRYIVLKEGKGRCALCGATKNEQPLDVDHIIPRNKGGSNELSNLQVLCAKCNRSKRDKDNTDFRDNIEPDNVKDCVFCNPDEKRIIDKNGSVFVLKDKYPVTEGHVLIIPARHTPEYFTMTQIERNHADEAIRVMKNHIQSEDITIVGFNIGMNCGSSAGQTIMHAHIHLIPRREGDTTNPRGGVRGVIPGKMSY